MKVSTTITASSKTLLSGWERALLVLPALAGLGLGFLLVFLPGRFAALTQFAADDAYIYQLAGAAILGYGVALSLSIFQQEWLAVRLVVIGVLVNNLGSLYACGIAIFSGYAPSSVYLFLATNLLFIAICGLLLARHRGVPHPEADFSSRTMQVFLIVGAIAAGILRDLPSVCAATLHPLQPAHQCTLSHTRGRRCFVRLCSCGSTGTASVKPPGTAIDHRDGCRLQWGWWAGEHSIPVGRKRSVASLGHRASRADCVRCVCGRAATDDDQDRDSEMNP